MAAPSRAWCRMPGRAADRLRAIEEIRELRKKNGRATVEEILSWRDEGRRY